MAAINKVHRLLVVYRKIANALLNHLETNYIVSPKLTKAIVIEIYEILLMHAIKGLHFMVLLLLFKVATHF